MAAEEHHVFIAPTGIEEEMIGIDQAVRDLHQAKTAQKDAWWDGMQAWVALDNWRSMLEESVEKKNKAHKVFSSREGFFK